MASDLASQGQSYPTTRNNQAGFREMKFMHRRFTDPSEEAKKIQAKIK
jgi:hypothetical protein